MTRLDSALSAVMAQFVRWLTAALYVLGTCSLWVPSHLLRRRFEASRLPCVPGLSRIGSGPLCERLTGEGHSRYQGLGVIGGAMANTIY